MLAEGFLNVELGFLFRGRGQMWPLGKSQDHHSTAAYLFPSNTHAHISAENSPLRGKV